MNLSAPQKATWWVGVILGVIGIVSNLVQIPVFSSIAFLLLILGWVALVLGTYLKGL